MATLVVPVLFIATNDAILPTPEAASPIVGSLFVHENLTPAGVPEKFTAFVLAPLHKD